MRTAHPGIANTEHHGRFMATILLALLLAGGTIMLTGCNTMEGLGKDTQAAGEALEEKAKESK